MNIRETMEQRELELLSPYASHKKKRNLKLCVEYN